MPESTIANGNCQNCGQPVSPRQVYGLCPRCLLAAIESEDKPESVAEIGHYEVLEEIASGGMGTIFKARDKALNRIVALKVITGGSIAAREKVERFQTEARAVASLSHPNIVPIYEVGEFDGQSYFTMEFVDGASLDKFQNGSPLPARDAARLIGKIARAVHFAHLRGILHRDVKPGNILLDGSGEPRLTDFGLAKVLESDSAITQTRSWLGTPSYMSPEQANGGMRDVTVATDVHGLGAVLYETLTGEPPFAGATTLATVRQVLEREPRRPSLLNPRVDRDLETICLKCLEKEPARRYASALDVARELDRWMRGEPILARPVGVVERAARWGRRKPKVAALVLSLALALAGGLSATLLQWRRAENEAQNARAAQERAELLVTRLDLERAEDHFRAGERAEALGLLGRVVRDDPFNRVAAERLISFLSFHSLLLPVFEGFGRGDDARIVVPSPNGQYVAIGRTGGALEVWTTEGAMAWSVANEASAAGSAWSPDGRFVAAGFFDGKGRVWEASTGQPAGPEIRQRPQLAPYFSWDGTRLVTWSWLSPVIRIWDWKSGELLREFSANEPLRGLRPSPTEDRILSATASGLQLWDFEGNPLHKLERTGYPNVGSWSPGGDVIAATLGVRGVVFYSAEDLSPLPFEFGATEVPEGRPAYSPDGLWLVMGSIRKVGEMRDLRDGRAINIPLLHGDSGRLAWLLADGARLLSANAPNCGARICDARPGRVLAEPMRHAARVRTAAFSPDGRLVLSTAADRSARLWHGESGQPASEVLAHPSPIRGAFFAPGSERFATIADDGRIRAWNRQGQQVAEINTSTRIHSALFRNDQEIVAATQGGVRIYEIAEGASGRVIDDSGPFQVVTADPRSGAFAAARVAPERELIDVVSDVRIWPETETNSARRLAIAGRVRALALNSGGTRLAYAATHGALGVRDLRRRRWLFEIAPDHERLNSVQFSLDGKWILTAGHNRTAAVFDATSGMEKFRTLPQDGPVAHAEFSRSGTRIATVTASGVLRLWNSENGMPLTGELRDLPSPVVGWSPSAPGSVLSADGERLLAVLGDHSVRALPVPIPPLPAPEWLGQLAESIGGRRVNASRQTEEVSWSDFLRLRTELQNVDGGDFYGRWARWFFADRAGRTISPWSARTVREYVDARANEPGIDAWFEVVRLEPGHALVRSRLAMAIAAKQVAGVFAFAKPAPRLVEGGSKPLGDPAERTDQSRSRNF
jgi:WD40 repeat protein/predicted Ser/Thr protein kinase